MNQSQKQQPIKRIGLYVRSRRNDLGECLQQLRQLLNAKPVEYFFERSSYQQLSPQLQQQSDTCFDADTNVETDDTTRLDLLLVVGGDGSFLHACQLFASGNTPLAGINLGRLGFLTDIGYNQLEQSLDTLIRGEGSCEQRHFIEGKTEQQHIHALNDIVIRSAATDSIIDLQVRVDGDLAFDLRCDGIVIASSTGSTAYGLSAGGPLLHPAVDALVLVPLAAHTLTARSCVIPTNHQLEIIQYSPAQYAEVIADGTRQCQMAYEQSITVDKSSHSITLIHPGDYNYFAACRYKLGWHVIPESGE